MGTRSHAARAEGAFPVQQRAGVPGAFLGRRFVARTPLAEQRAQHARLRRQLRGLGRRLQHSTAGKSAEAILEEREDGELLLGALAPSVGTMC